MGEETTDVVVENNDVVENGTSNQDENQTAGTVDQTVEGTVDKPVVEEKVEEKTTPQADEEPKTRKRNVDFILERKNKQIEKLKNREIDPVEDEEDDDIDEDDAKIIDKRVAKILSPFLDKQIQDEDAQEIGNFIKDNPDFAGYADKVKKFAQHESRKHLPIKALFYEVAGDDLLKIGADRAKKALDEAKETVAGGSTGETDTAEKGVWALTPEEFAKQQEALRNRPRD